MWKATVRPRPSGAAGIEDVHREIDRGPPVGQALGLGEDGRHLLDGGRDQPAGRQGEVGLPWSSSPFRWRYGSGRRGKFRAPLARAGAFPAGSGDGHSADAAARAAAALARAGAGGPRARAGGGGAGAAVPLGEPAARLPDDRGAAAARGHRARLGAAVGMSAEPAAVGGGGGGRQLLPARGVRSRRHPRGDGRHRAGARRLDDQPAGGEERLPLAGAVLGEQGARGGVHAC